MPFGFGRQLRNIPRSLNDLNLLPTPIIIPATMAVANPTAEGHDENYSPQLTEPSEPSPMSTPPMNLSKIEGWETPHTTTDDNTLYSDDEPRRIYFLLSDPSPRPPPRKLKTKLSLRMSFPKKRECRSTSVGLVHSLSLSQRTYQARRQQTKNSRPKISYTYFAIFSIISIKMIRSSYVSTLCIYM